MTEYVRLPIDLIEGVPIRLIEEVDEEGSSRRVHRGLISCHRQAYLILKATRRTQERSPMEGMPIVEPSGPQNGRD